MLSAILALILGVLRFLRDFPLRILHAGGVRGCARGGGARVCGRAVQLGTIHPPHCAPRCRDASRRPRLPAAAKLIYNYNVRLDYVTAMLERNQGKPLKFFFPGQSRAFRYGLVGAAGAASPPCPRCTYTRTRLR